MIFRVVIAIAVLLQSLVIGEGSYCLFHTDVQIIWLLPPLMLWTQFTLAFIFYFSDTVNNSASSMRTRMLLNLFFYAITSIASTCVPVSALETSTKNS